VLHWQQPHPIFLAELEYRLHPTRATLDKWKEVVFETAQYMADFPTRDPKTGIFSLTPVMTAAEIGVAHNPAFELAYWRFGLEKAQAWRERLGLAREPFWDEVCRNLAPLPMNEGTYVFAEKWLGNCSAENVSHPDPLGVCAFLPLNAAIDPHAARRTVRKVWETWKWDSAWDWDFPWIAMAAARTGQPDLAVDGLMKVASRNRYPVSGIEGDWYLAGNMGLLYAAAMMAAGWDGAPQRHAPGFPDDGSWSVRWEGLRPAP
jgi:hypothetical protein